MKKVVIIGGGCAGLTAAIYLGRAGYEVLVYNDSNMGMLSTSPFVQNFPGFPDGISGSDLLMNMESQAEKFGAEIYWNRIVSIDPDAKTVLSDNGIEVNYDYLIIATGSTNRKYNAQNFEKYDGHGIHYCATCDGGMYKGKKVAVLGGGNTALTEASYLSKICDEVYLIHRRDQYRAEDHLVDIVLDTKNIIPSYERIITSFEGDDKKLSSLVLNDNEKIDVDGCFVAIGSDPNTELINNIDLNKYPYIKLCGDVSHIDNKEYNQAVIACAEGAKIAIDIIKGV